MANQARSIPEGQDAAIPYLAVKDGSKAIDFYKKAFGATEVFRTADPSGKIGHAELKIGGGRIFLADEYPERGFVSPRTLGGSPVMMHLYVEDVDSVAKKAVAAGAKEVQKVENQFYGDRGGKFEDPFGHQWWIATHVEDVSPEELKTRAKKEFGG